jgi:hypothetical protein
MLLWTVLAAEAIWGSSKEVLKEALKLKGAGFVEKIGDSLLARTKEGTLPPNHNLDHALRQSLAKTACALAYTIYDPDRLPLSKLITDLKVAALFNRVAEMIQKNVFEKRPGDYWLFKLIEESKNPDNFKNFSFVLLLEGSQLTSLVHEQLDQRLRDHVQTEFLVWCNHHVPDPDGIKPSCFDDYVSNGWSLSGASGRKITFYEVFCSFFREELKNSEVVFRAFTVDTLAKLQGDMTEMLAAAPSAEERARLEEAFRKLGDFAGFKEFLNSQDEKLFSFLREEFDKVHDRFDSVDAKLDKLLDVKAQPKSAAEQIPPADGDLKGRILERERIAAALKSGRHVVIHGMPGLGKTQLALSVANELKQDFPAGQIFVPLQIQATTVQRPCEVLIAALRVLKGSTAELPKDQVSLRTAYDNALADGKWLVVVDNAQTADEAKVLKPHTPCGLLVTARPKLILDGADCVRPDFLSSVEAKEFLQIVCPRLSNDIAHTIAELCGYLPLALRNAGTFLSLYDDKDPAQYAIELSDERTRLKRLNPHDDLVDVEASFNLSYGQLSSETANVFARLAVFPATFNREAEAAICEDIGSTQLSQLVRQGLVFHARQTDRYYLHDLLRLFAQSRLRDSERVARIRHAEYFADVLAKADEIYSVDGEEFRSGLELFEVERSNIIAAWAWAVKEFDVDEGLASLCSRFAKVGGRIAGGMILPEQRIVLYEAASRAATRLNEPELRAEHLYDQAQAIYDSGRQQEIGRSTQLLQESLVSAKGPKLRVLILAQLGRNHLRCEPQNKHAALSCQKSAWQIAQETDDTILKVRCMTRLASAYFANHQQHQAQHLYDSALAMVKPSQERLRTFVLNGYGQMFRDPLYRKMLIPLLDEARRLAEKYGGKRDGKDTNFKLGMCLLDSEPAAALECFRTSLEMNRAWGDQRGIAGSYRDIGRAHLKLNQFAEATAALNDSRSLCQIIHWERGLQDVDKLLEKARRASR